MQKFLAYLQLMRFDRPIGTFLLLWPTLWAVWLSANHYPPLKIIIIFILGVIIMRAAGCVINDIADRKFDPHVKRTQNRPLARQAISLTGAIALLLILFLIAFLLVLRLNSFCLYIAIIAACLTVFYPFCKRFTYFPQVILSITFQSGILMAFAAQQNHLPIQAWILYIACILWMIAYDTMYAITDQDDDRKLGLKSTALLFATKANMIILVLQIFFLVGLIITGIFYHLSWLYWIGFIIACYLSMYQQKLLKENKPFKAFLNNNWLGLTVFIGILLGLYL